MRRWWIPAAVLLVGLLTWWLWPGDEGGETGSSSPNTVSEAPSSANEGALPETLKPSVWNAPIQQRGERKLTGVVTRDGQPVAGAIVTAVAAHGDEVLSDLPCKCDNHCGQMLLACGCAEASGQLVELVASRTGEGVPLARSTSAADGTFTLTGLDTTTLTLYADATDGVGWLANVASDASDVKLAMSAGRTIRGKVLTTGEKPASGALVTAIFSKHSRFFDVVADEKGEFTLGPLPAGKYAVVAMQAGLLPDHQQVADDETEGVTLELSVPRSLSGVVLADGAPVPGATVKLAGMHRKRTVTSDEKGEFRIERLRPGEYELTAESSKGMGVASAFVGKLQDLTGVAITMGKGEPLAGHVLTESGDPVSEARVMIRGPKSWRQVFTDASGAFRFEGVPTEELTVFAEKKGLLQAKVQARGGQTGVELRLPPAAILSGLVRSSAGELVASFSVRATPLDGGSEDQSPANEQSVDGGFALDVWPGEYELRVSAAPFAPQTIKVVAPRAGIEVVLEPGATIRGRVLDFDGVPAEGAVVNARSETDLAAGASGKSDDQGRFELTGLTPGTFTVRAIKSEDHIPLWRASAQVTVSKQGVSEVTLQAKAGAPLAGVVLSAEGEPIAGVEVMAWQKGRGADDEDGPQMGTSVSDAQGRFRIRSLGAGKAQLVARDDERHLEGTLEATAPDENLIVKLKAGTTVSGRVIDAEGKPITAFKVLHENVEALDGRFKVPVPTRVQTLAIDAPGYAQLIRAVKLTEGDNPLGDLVLQRGRPVTGVIRDARTRAPIPGALVDVGLERGDLEFYLSEQRGAVMADAQGRYRLPAVDTSSTWIFASADGYVNAAQPLTGNSSDFELRPAGKLVVKVLDEKGAPARRAYPSAKSADGGRGMLMPDFAHQGTYVSKGLAPGTWTVSVLGDGSTYRSQTVTVGETNVEVVMRPATDGVTIEVKINGETDSAILVPGTLSSTAGLKGLVDFVDLRRGVGRNVLPGSWTVVLYKRGNGAGESSLQPIEVKDSGNPVFTITPQWQPIPEHE